MERPKVVYQEIQFHSWFAIDRDGHYLNNLIHFLPCDDPGVVAALNSSLLWWFMWHTAPHKKDEAYALHAFYVENLPVAPADPDPGLRLVALTRDRQSIEEEFLDRLRSEVQLEKVTHRLETFWDLDEPALYQELTRAGARLNPVAAAEVRRRFLDARAALLPRVAEARTLEARVHQSAFDAYGLTADEIALVKRTAPPRDPLALLEQRVPRRGRKAGPAEPDLLAGSASDSMAGSEVQVE
jgi:hypothetical protein